MSDPAVDTGLTIVAANEGLPSASSPNELRRDVLALIDGSADPQVQVEASRLLTCVADLPTPAEPGDVALVQSALAALTGKSVNVRVAKFARNRLEIRLRNQRRGPVPWLSRRLGDSAVYAMLVGAAVSALIWGISFAAVIVFSGLWISATNSTFIMPPAEAAPLAFAAFVGGLVSLLSRVNRFASLYIFDPILVFVNSLLKPLIGTIFALTLYALLKSEIIQVSAVSFDLAQGENRHVFWAFGFIAGFSERLAGDFIARTETVIGRAPDAGDAGRPQR